VGTPTSRRNPNTLLENKDIRNIPSALDLMGMIILKFRP
jgi:hypothetical protein